MTLAIPHLLPKLWMRGELMLPYYCFFFKSMTSNQQRVMLGGGGDCNYVILQLHLCYIN